MAVMLIVLGCVLAPIAVIGVWTANQVSDTNRYIANIEPLIHEPPIQNALTGKVTTAITSHLNVTGYVDQASAELTGRGLTRVGALVKSFAPGGPRVDRADRPPARPQTIGQPDVPSSCGRQPLMQGASG